MLQNVTNIESPTRRPMIQRPSENAAARDQLLAEIARLRDAIFALTDIAPGLHDRVLAEVPVRLQAAAYELGQAERMLEPAPIA
jgi:hypothetical protein